MQKQNPDFNVPKGEKDPHQDQQHGQGMILTKLIAIYLKIKINQY